MTTLDESPALQQYEIGADRVAVRLAGDPARPALLLIHGFPSSSESFRRVIGPLARECFVIAPDLPGFGGSEPIERPSFSRFADAIHELLARLHVGAHILDGPHFLLETHPDESAALISGFVRRVEGLRGAIGLANRGPAARLGRDR